ncbi:MAG: class I SAM-dependent methyltransferase [Phycisphaerales bacterium]|nr:class I SAM-dependent methyltransferase [Phycisphaerales bacterium]
MTKITAPKYDEFYAAGGWKYRPDFEMKFLGEMTAAAGLAEGSEIVEIGCGQGFHAKILHDLGFTVTANDLSQEGIAFAKTNYEGPDYHAGDAADFLSGIEPESVDAVFIRGMSWFHYKFTDDRPLAAKRMMPRIARIVKPGGAILLMIKTDYTGTETAGGVYNHLWTDFPALLGDYGTITRMTDWRGMVLNSEEDGRASGHGMSVVVKTEGASGG